MSTYKCSVVLPVRAELVWRVLTSRNWFAVLILITVFTATACSTNSAQKHPKHDTHSSGSAISTQKAQSEEIKVGRNEKSDDLFFKEDATKPSVVKKSSNEKVADKTSDTQVPKSDSDNVADNTSATANFYEQSPNSKSVVSYSEAKDPLEWLNRPIFKFNNASYVYVLSPLSKAYQKILPNSVDKRVKHFFKNLREPINLANHLFQGELINSASNLTRFVVNSTVGVLGLFDASDAIFSLSPRETNFDETLKKYGVGRGVYIVIPILGPSDIRDGTRLFVDRYGHLARQLADNGARNSAIIFDGFQSQVVNLADYPDLVRELEDPYTFVRNFYIQNRQRDEIFVPEGEPSEK